MNTRSDGNIEYVNFSMGDSQVRFITDEDREKPLAYVFELEPQGYVVVSGDYNLVPVICYSEHGRFTFEEHPDNHLLNMLRKDLRLRLEAVEYMDIERIEGYHRQWKAMIKGDPAYLDPGDSWPPAGSTWTGGWVETAWHQYSPYNDLCPMDPETGLRSVVGCVATAMAQIVNYWQYPGSVIFTPDDSYISTRYGNEIPIDAPLASIHFVDYGDGNPRDEICAAISYACGVGSRMFYSSSTSAADMLDTRISFLKHFNYIRAQYIYARDSVTGDSSEFYSILQENMKDAQPAMISIGGHAIVCDGFRQTSTGNEWHLNFGWGIYSPPIADAWYKLPDSLPYGYSDVYYGILNIDPPTRYVEEPIEELTIVDCSPNPFTDYTRIIFTLPVEDAVNVSLLNSAGLKICDLMKREFLEGINGFYWNGKGPEGEYVQPGAYLIQLSTGSDEACRHVTFLGDIPTDSTTPLTPLPESVHFYPVIFTDHVDIDFFLFGENPMTVNVYDANGRLVRNLANQICVPGQQEFTWDGTDDYGNPKLPGVYFICINSQLLHLTGKVVLIR